MRLCDATLAHLPLGVRRPGYDRGAVQPGIVHLGVGAFHRAHQAVVADAALRAGDMRWGITGASLRSPATRDALASQDGLYALNVRSEGDEYAVIGSVIRLFVAPENPSALLGAMAHPATRIISLTVTEKAYCLDPATGLLDEAHPDIRHDLEHPGAPRSAPGFLVAALAARRRAGSPPPTVLCCDNLPRNGAVLHRLLMQLAARMAPGLDRWIRDEVACPSTMVDRIVPATTNADRARVKAALGLEDAWPVVAEPFLQWVVEDRFTAGRPPWEMAGVQFVGNVAPFEAMKLRLLNGSHSALAYLGSLAGHETVAEAMGDAGLAVFVQGLMADAASTLSVPSGTDVAGYAHSLLQRFRNPALQHRTWQIAMDGSQKLPQRLLGVVRERLDQNQPVDRHALAVAAWMRYVAGPDERGRPVDVRDPLAAEIAAAARAAGPVPERLAPALLGLSSVFGSDLPADPRFRTAVTEALSRLYAVGASHAAELTA